MKKRDDVAIQVENIGKCYRIGVKEEMHDTFGMAALNFLKRPLKNYRKYRSLYEFSDMQAYENGHGTANSPDIIWALKNVSFEVQRGEVVGIIGFNGAGKSTLLKILCKITVPTCGRAIIRGRVSSLLEVGTGFHPELTGRDNIYLNGAMLGMKKTEIEDRFDEIVEFSGVERFIDTPVKRYSSGMRVRLAFAVAAHLEPEILLIDEVLAVGDVRFQKKCLNKMQDVSQRGRTVLFVSHNMPAVTRLCPRSILLDGGRIIADGPSHQVVSTYLNSERGLKAQREWSKLSEAPGDEVVRLVKIRARTQDGAIADCVDINKPVGIEIEYEVLQAGYVFVIYYHVINEEGIEAFTTFDNDPSWKGRARPTGRYISTAWIPGCFLSEGMFYIGPVIRTVHPQVYRLSEREAIVFQAVDVIENDSEMDEYRGKFNGGVVRPVLKWETKFIQESDEAGVGGG